MDSFLFSKLPTLLCPPYYTASSSKQGMASLMRPLQLAVWGALERNIKEQLGLAGPLTPAEPLQVNLLHSGQIVDAAWITMINRQALIDQPKQKGTNRSNSRGRGRRQGSKGGFLSGLLGGWWGRNRRQQQQQQQEQDRSVRGGHRSKSNTHQQHEEQRSGGHRSRATLQLQQQQEEQDRSVRFGGHRAKGTPGRDAQDSKRVDGATGSRGATRGPAEAGRSSADKHPAVADGGGGGAVASALGSSKCNTPDEGEGPHPHAGANLASQLQQVSEVLKQLPKGTQIVPIQGKVAQFTAQGIRLANGTYLPADVVLYCTGYMKTYDYLTGGIKVGDGWV
jgi:hypothetical protein